MKGSGTVDETYTLYNEGLSIEEIGERRGLTVMTIEKHLAECIVQGRDIVISRHVEAADRELIEKAIEQFGPHLLKPLREVLPPHITYRMIRFVVAEIEHGTAKRTVH
jgi:ATP-dependent DNA helicase RecQ